METQPHKPCPRCDYPIHSPSVAICSECGLDLQAALRPQTSCSLLFKPTTLLFDPFEQAWERRQRIRIPILALLMLMVSTFLATIAVVIEWYPAEIDQTGKFVWVGRVRSILNHHDLDYDHVRTNFEHGHANLVYVRNQVRTATHTQLKSQNKTRLINPRAHVSISWPSAVSFWRLFAFYAAPCILIAMINRLSPPILFWLNTHPSVSRHYIRRIRRRLANLAFIGLFWQAVVIGVCSIHDLAIGPLIGTPAMHEHALGIEVLGGLIYFCAVYIRALEFKNAKHFFSSTFTIQFAHAAILMLAITLSMLIAIVGALPRSRE